MKPSREDHFEAICSYLSSGLGKAKGLEALQEEAIQMVQEAPPSEDVIFSAIFTSESFALVRAIHAAHGTEIFRNLDPFGHNVRSLWRTSSMPAEDIGQVFEWVFDAWEDVFTEDPHGYLVFALETCIPKAISLAKDKVKPSTQQIANALAIRRCIYRIPPENAEIVCDLIKKTRAEPAWKHLIRDAFSGLSTTALNIQYLRAIALTAKCGVDMTGFASDLSEDFPKYQKFFSMAATRHGQFQLVSEFPSIAEIMTMERLLLEDLIQNPSKPPK